MHGYCRVARMPWDHLNGVSLATNMMMTAHVHGDWNHRGRNDHCGKACFYFALRISVRRYKVTISPTFP